MRSVLYSLLLIWTIQLSHAKEHVKEEWIAKWESEGDPAYTDSLSSWYLEQGDACSVLAWEAIRARAARKDVSDPMRMHWALARCRDSLAGQQWRKAMQGRHGRSDSWYRNRAQQSRIRRRPGAGGDWLAMAAILFSDRPALWLEAHYAYKAARDFPRAAWSLFRYCAAPRIDFEQGFQRLRSFAQSESSHAVLVDSVAQIEALPEWRSETLLLRWWRFRRQFRSCIEPAHRLLQSGKNAEAVRGTAEEALLYGDTASCRMILEAAGDSLVSESHAWLALRARLAVAGGRHSDAGELLRESWRLFRTGESARDYALHLIRHTRQPQTALTVLGNCRNEWKGWECERLLHEALLLADRIGVLRPLVEKALRRPGLERAKDARLHFMLGQIYACESNWKKAEEKWSRTVSLGESRDLNDAAFLLGLRTDFRDNDSLFKEFWGFRMMALRGRLSEAARGLENLVPDTWGKGREKLVCIAAQWWVEAGGAKNAVALLEAEKARCGSCERVLLTLARIQMEMPGNVPAGIRVYEELMLKYPQSVFVPEAQHMLRKHKLD